MSKIGPLGTIVGAAEKLLAPKMGAVEIPPRALAAATSVAPPVPVDFPNVNAANGLAFFSSGTAGVGFTASLPVPAVVTSVLEVAVTSGCWLNENPPNENAGAVAAPGVIAD